jgi:hypothetical protein
MKLPKYIACIASYYDTNPEVVVMHSLVITRTKDDTVMVSRTFHLNDYSDDEACNEIDGIVGDFKDKYGSADVVFGENPIKIDRTGTQFTIRAITANDYRRIMKVKEKDRHGMYGLE